MKCTLLYFFSLAVLLSGCSRLSETLVQYNEGSITRGDFYAWLDTNADDKKAVANNKTLFNEKLEAYALQRIAVTEAQNSKFSDAAPIRLLI